MFPKHYQWAVVVVERGKLTLTTPSAWLEARQATKK